MLFVDFDFKAALKVQNSYMFHPSAPVLEIDVATFVSVFLLSAPLTLELCFVLSLSLARFYQAHHDEWLLMALAQDYKSSTSAVMIGPLLTTSDWSSTWLEDHSPK